VTDGASLRRGSGTSGTSHERHGGEPVIQVQNLTKTYRTGKIEVPALKGVSLTLERGEFVAVMGPSGSGKSTFLNLVGCLDHPTSGSYFLDGTDVATLSDDQLAGIRNHSIGFVFQGFNLLARTTALHNVELPLVYNGRRSRETPARELLEAVGLPGRAMHTPNELSGGEQQRVAIARSLVNAPSIILADEPTGNLDSAMSREIMSILTSLNEAGMTILMVTHEEDIAAYAHRLVRFKDGRIVSDEPLVRVHAADGPRVDLSRLRERVGAKHGKRRSIFSPGELWENVRSAMRSLWQNRMRAVLTALGILIGVGAVIAMVSVGQGSTASIQDRIQGLGSNLLTIMAGSTTSGGIRQGFGSATTLTYEDADAIREKIAGITGVAPEMESRVQARYLRNTWVTSVVGTTADYPTVRNWNVSSGAFFTEEDNKNKRTVTVLGVDVVTNLFGEGVDPIGKVVKLGPVSFKVVGVLEQKGTGGSFFSQDNTILVPILTAQARFTGRKIIRSMTVSVEEKNQMNAVKADIAALLRERHKLAEDGSADDFTITSQEDILKTVQGVSQTMTLLLASIAGISLLVGGIGIMNIMLVSVTERTREIGIRKALGARRRDILAQFLTEAVILSGIGGLLGWGLGWAASRIISSLGTTTVIAPATVILALGFSIAVGVFFGIYPANKASRMDPIQALHFE
jgi:macrolide transport system ATP-binding/permease protein